MSESDLKRPAEELESGGESWVLDEREQGWGLHEIAIMVTLLTLMTAGLAAGLGWWVWRRVSGSAMDVGHDYGKGFELEQDDTLRRAEENLPLPPQLHQLTPPPFPQRLLLH